MNLVTDSNDLAKAQRSALKSQWSEALHWRMLNGSYRNTMGQWTGFMLLGMGDKGLALVNSVMTHQVPKHVMNFASG